MLKLLIQFIFLLIALPITCLFFLQSLLTSKESCLASYSQFFSLFPGKVGVYLRSGFYRLAFTKFAPDAVVSFGVLFSQHDTDIGSGVYIGPQSNIGKCSIGQDSLLGSGVHILSGKNQHYFDDPTIPIKDQGGIFTKVTIGKNCWIGNCAIIMANLGDNCVVAAGSVVTNDVPDNSIVAGNPAKVIKTKSKTD